MLVNIHEAKTNFSRLVDRAAAGEEIIIGRAGQPVARLVAFAGKGEPRTPGSMAGRIAIADEFDDTPADLIAAFEGEGEGDGGDERDGSPA